MGCPALDTILEAGITGFTWRGSEREARGAADSSRSRRGGRREIPVAFGDTLRQARVARGLDLTRVEADTRILRRYLVALEAQDYAALPSAVYARGLLRSYAAYLELPPELVLAGFRPPRPATIREAVPLPPRRLPRLSPLWWLLPLLLLGAGALGHYLADRYGVLRASLDAPATAAAVERLDVPPLLLRSWTPQPRELPTPLLVAALQTLDTPTPTPTPGPSPTVEPLTLTAIALAPEVGTPTPTPTRPAPPTTTPTPTPRPNAPVVVEARVLEGSWLQVWADGRQVFAELLPPNSARTFTANDTLRMRVGNAGGIQVVVNGEPQGRLGASGQAVDVTWGRR